MKYFIRSVIFICISLITFSISACNSEEYEEVDQFYFSHQSGCYNDEFVLKIYAPYDSIYYTLDGSDPTYEAIKYTDGIYIRNDNSYRLAYESDISGGYYCLEDTEYQKKSNYRTDFETIARWNGMSIKAIYYDSNNKPSEIITGFYLITDDTSELYTISITANPSSFLDYYTGILVLGENFELWKIRDPNWYEQNPWRWWRGNFRQRGREWEREANVFIYDGNTSISQTKAGIRVKGNVSRGFAQKSFNIYFRKDYGNDKGYLFPDGYEARKITLDACAGDISKIQDKIVSDFCRGMKFSVMTYTPAQLFLNGEYWGYYNLTEKYDDNYIQYYYGLDKNNIVLIKDNDIEEGNEIDLEKYKNDIEFLSTADLYNAEYWEKANLLFDIDSLIDYFAVQTYINNSDGDWPKGNTALFRSREIEDSNEYADCRWRWMLFDLNGNVLMDNTYCDTDTIAYLLENCTMFNNLWMVEDFRNRFLERLHQLQYVFAPQLVEEYIADYKDNYLLHLEKSYRRFFDNNALINEKLENINQFYCNRPEVIEQLYRKYK